MCLERLLLKKEGKSKQALPHLILWSASFNEQVVHSRRTPIPSSRWVAGVCCSRWVAGVCCSHFLFSKLISCFARTSSLREQLASHWWCYHTISKLCAQPMLCGAPARVSRRDLRRTEKRRRRTWVFVVEKRVYLLHTKIKCAAHFPQKNMIVGERVTQIPFHHVSHISRASTKSSCTESEPIPPSWCLVSFQGGPSSHDPTKIYSQVAQGARRLWIFASSSNFKTKVFRIHTHLSWWRKKMIPHQEKKQGN